MKRSVFTCDICSNQIPEAMDNNRLATGGVISLGGDSTSFEHLCVFCREALKVAVECCIEGQKASSVTLFKLSNALS